MHILSTPIDYLKGVGPARANLFRNELSILTYGDLLHHYPFRYIDKSKIYNISQLRCFTINLAKVVFPVPATPWNSKF